ncbi:uncharacterized protein LOC114946537 [Nylanderia fulva]|uniref:uncharacterized protein LOC114946537 n=1 Tax=Nylanderia fulva TaxID=613905 RepID=UPI0010FBAF73|nr:uncharacterized protein LOC114946537 [Nylanderia fulva]
MLYSITHWEKLKIKSFYIKVSTELPVANGLGSSTSFAVCLAGCFLHWQRLQSGCNHIEFNNAELESIIKYTVSCEKNMQDYVYAEFDAHVCTYGHIVRCRRIDHMLYDIDSSDLIEMYILLIDSTISINKCMREEQVAYLCNNSSDFNIKLDELNIVAGEMYNNLISLSNAIREGHLDYITILFNMIRSCVEKNHTLLTEYRLSVVAFDLICQNAKKFGFAGKLTGFTTVYAYILLPQNVKIDDEITSLTAYMTQRTFRVSKRIKINCEGVRIVN